MISRRLRELNYVFIPSSPEQMERWRKSRIAKLLSPAIALYLVLTTEGQVVAVATLISGAAGIDVRFSHIYVIFSALFSLLVTAFALRRFAETGGHLAITVEHPARISVGEPLTLTVVLTNTGPKSLYALRVLGPFLPWDGEWVTPRPRLPVLPAGATARLTVQARFGLRGHREIDGFSVASVRPLGLVMGRRASSERLRFTVVPRFPLLLGVGIADPLLAAASAPNAVVRDGLSFEVFAVRPYRPGDRIRDLHARSWARAGEPMVREYAREVQPRAGLVIDSTGLRGQRDLLESMVELAAGLGAVLVRHGRLEVMTSLAAGRATEVGRLDGVLEALVEVGATDSNAEHPSALAARCAGGLPRGAEVHLVTSRLDEATAIMLECWSAGGNPTRVFVVDPKATVDVAREGPGVLRLRPSAIDAPHVWVGT